MKKNNTKILLFSLVLLALISSYSSYKPDKSLKGVFASAIIVLIPAIYSLIPLLKEQRLKKSAKKNRLTDFTFTDRQEDLTELVEKISSHDHILEINGKDPQCGKTWLAKKLCDYINFPSDKENSRISAKCVYTRAFYINMDEYTEKNLNDFFQKEYIDSKTVLIFDHVIDLGMLLTKQKLYHFQLIYILKYNEEKSFQRHTISDFNAMNIIDLQGKIKNNYPGITYLNKTEINVLYRLTNGNIGKIHTLLCEQKCIDWIKAIADNQLTDYDVELNKIQATLYTGKYIEARKELSFFEKNYNEAFEKNNDLKFKYTLMLSDCEHLLNNYEKAMGILSTIESKYFSTNNNNYEIELHKAHYFKHLWKCNESLEILQSLKDKTYSAAADSLGIIVAKYFIDDLFIPSSNNNSLEEFKNMYVFAQNSTLTHDRDDELRVKRSEAIYLYYTKHPSSPSELLEKIDYVIKIYRAQNNRLLANAYFIRGEIYRLYCDFDKAFNDYRLCLSVTRDNNIIVQVNLMMYYLCNCKKIQLSQSVSMLETKDITDLCSKNNYADKLFQRIHCIELNDPNANDIMDCFDTRIMPIL